MNSLLGILRSVVIVSLVSGGFAFVFEDFGMLRVFGAVSIIQVLGFMGWSTLIGYLRRNEMLKEMDILSKQGLEVQCPCPKGEPAFVPIDLGEDNTYECECGKRCGVNIETSTFLVTTPIDLEQSQRKMAKTFDDVSKKLGKSANPETITVDRNDLNILEDEDEIEREEAGQ